MNTEEVRKLENYPFIITWWPFHENIDDSLGPRSIPQYYDQVISTAIYVIVLTLQLFIIIRIIAMLSRQGTSKTLYRKVCIRYIIFFLFLIPFYIDRLILTIGSLTQYKSYNGIVFELREVMFITAFIQTMACVCEPFVLRTFKQIIYVDLVNCLRCCNRNQQNYRSLRYSMRTDQGKLSLNKSEEDRELRRSRAVMAEKKK